jgi:hypothetical protein
LEWLFLVGTGLIGIAIIVFVSEAAKKKRDREKGRLYGESIEAEKSKLVTGALAASLPVLDAAQVAYRTVGKEILSNGAETGPPIGVQKGPPQR